MKSLPYIILKYAQTMHNKKCRIVLSRVCVAYQLEMARKLLMFHYLITVSRDVINLMFSISDFKARFTYELC